MRLYRNLKRLKGIAMIFTVALLVFPLFADFYRVSADPVAPKSKHLPQISVPAPGGVSVNTWNGNLFFPLQLLSLPGRGLSVNLSLSYNSTWYNTKLNYGYGWQFSYNMQYEQKGNGDIVIVWEDGRSETFVNNSGSFVAPADTYNTLSQYESGKYKLTTKSGEVYFFDNSSHKKITKMQEPNGNSLTFTYNGDKLMTKVTDSSGREVTFSYTDSKLTQISDANANPARNISITYDANENLTEITDPKGAKYTFEYNSEHFLTKIRDKNNTNTTISYTTGIAGSVTHDTGAAMYFSFDKTNRITSVIGVGEDNKHSVNRYFYDSQGRVTKFERVKDGQGNVITQEFTWDANNNLLTFKNENNGVTSYTYDSKGNILTITDPLNKVTTYTYEATFNKVATVTDANNKTTTYQYDAKGNLLKTIDPLNNETDFLYAANGDLLTTTNANDKVTSYSYNNFGYNTQITNPLTHVVASTYDNAGRVVSTTDPNNNTVSYEYDANGNKTKTTDALNHFETYTYDAQGNMVSKTDVNNKTTTFEYDRMGRVTRELDAAGNSTRYQYDKQGNLKSVIDAKDNTTSYQYDYLGRLTKEIDPLGKVTSYEYDSVGNLIKKTDPNGNVAIFTYDAANRLTSANYPGTNNDVSYTYDNVGNILTESNPDVSIARTYDELNRVLTVNTTVGSLNKLVSYEYDAMGNRVEMTDPDNGITTYAYDDANRLVTLTNPQNKVTRYSYDNGGRITEKELGNGSYLAYEYDAVNRLTKLENRKSDDSVISKYEYTYDNGGNITSLLLNGTDLTTYSYDNVYRLTQANYPGAGIENYSYDAVGNRTNVTDQVGGANYTYNAADRMLTAGTLSFTYDSNGNQLTRTQSSSTTAYAYDAKNNLTGITFPDTTTNQFKYYPDGRRLSMTDKSGNTTLFFYDGANDLIETAANGTTQKRYTSNGIDEWLGMTVGSDNYYYLTDGQNSVSKIVDSNENTVKSYTYNAFGIIGSQTGSLNNSMTYTGRRFDSEANLYQYRARYYDATTGRFTQKDPSGMVDGTNMYVYVKGNPVNLVDPFGKQAYPSNAWEFIKQSNTVATIKEYGSWGLGIADGLIPFGIVGHGFNLLGLESITKNKMYLDGKYGSTLGSIPKSARDLVGAKSAEVFLAQSLEIGADSSDFQEGYSVLMNEKIPRAEKEITGTVNSIIDAFRGWWNFRQNGYRMNSTHNYIDTPIRDVVIASAKEGTGEMFTEMTVVSYRGATGGLQYAILATDKNGNQTYYLQNPNNPNEFIGIPANNNDDKWRVSYFSDKNMNHHVSTQDEEYVYIDKDWGTGNAGPVGPDNFSVRFEKRVHFERTGLWKFKVQSDDGFRLYIDNEQIGAEWWDAWHDVGPSKQLSAGFHDIRLDYYDSGSTAKVKLEWGIDYSGDEGVWLCKVTGWYNDHRPDCMKFTKDAPSLGNAGLGNDVVKSITIVGNWKAALFMDDNYGGEYQYFDGHKADLNSPPSIIGHNMASSVKVLRTEPAKYTLHDLGDFNGAQFKGDKDITNLKHFNFNDTAESISVASGYEVIVCEHEGFRGGCGRTTSNKASIADLNSKLREGPGAAQGTATSIRVCEGTCPAAPVSPTNVIPANGSNYVTGSTVTMQWFGNGDEYLVELWGGSLAQATTQWGSNTYWTKTGLQPSANPYFWRVKGWNEYGEGSWSQTWNFKVENVSLTSTTISGDSTGYLNTDILLGSAFEPINATAPLTYTWSPAPKSGQGTANPIYNFDTFGEKTINLTLTNAAGNVNTSHNITIGCPEDKYKVSYYEGTSVSGESRLDGCEDEIDYNWGNEGPVGVTVEQFGNGQDGALTISSNTTDAPIDSAASGTGGATSLSATNSGFAAGQRILIHQTQGTSGAGKYQVNEILSYSPGTITLKSPLNDTYISDSSNKAQVLVIKQYTNVTVNSGVTWTAKPWNGTTGGILTFLANATVTVSGQISSNGGNGTSSTAVNPAGGSGGGFRGGAGNRPTSGSHVKPYTGESQLSPSLIGNADSVGHPINGNAGTPASFNNGTLARSGGGGGNGTAGAAGTASMGGQAYGNPELSLLPFGGGGGGGGRGESAGSGSGGGGAGGGAIFITAPRINVSGGIKSNGGNGGSDPAAAGGGGAGGSILLKTQKANIGNNLVTANGGLGGGNGGQGRIAIQYCDSYSGSTTPAFNSTEIVCERDNFSARWTKTQHFDAGEYAFESVADDGVKVWVDENLIIDDWNEGYSESQTLVELSEGDHDIKVEYFEVAQGAQIKVINYPSTNQIPVINEIPGQIINPGDSFTTFDLDNFGSDPDVEDETTWSYAGNSLIQVNINQDNLVTLTYPQNWKGQETISFKLTDSWGKTTTRAAVFRVLECNVGSYLGEYYNNTSFTGDPKLVQCENIIDYDWGIEGPSIYPSTNLDVPNGTTKYTDDVRAKVATTANNGQNVINLASTMSLTNGDEVLVIQMSGTNAGKFEFAEVNSINGTVLTLKNNLINTYTNAGTSKAQVIKVEKYNNATINGTVTAHPWDGNTGGVLMFRAKNITVGSTGKIDASNLGYSGGPGGSEAPASKGDTGHTGGSIISDQPLNGPVASGDCGGCTSPAGPYNSGGGYGGRGSRGTDAAGGGGGGSHGTQGTAGQTPTQWPNPPGGQPGDAYGVADLNYMIFMGSGGGGGGKGKDGYGGLAGRGGGIVMVHSDTLTVNGQILSKGQNGVDNGSGNAGGGGGGAGGSVLIKTKEITTSPSKILIGGGTGSTGNAGGNGKPGGNGGLGRARLEYCHSLNGSTDSYVAVQQVSCEQNNFGIRWRGFQQIQNAGDYIIETNSDDGIKVWVDDQLTIDNWTAGYHEESETVNLSQGLHEIKVEYFEDIGNASIELFFYPVNNSAPTVSTLENRTIGAGDTFAQFDLDDYGSDPDNDPVTWSYTGNSTIQVAKDSNNVITLTYPQGWYGEESITFEIKDQWRVTNSFTTSFKVLECAFGEYKYEYFGNVSLNGNPTSTGCEETLNHSWQNLGPNGVGSSNFGNGQDGAITISANTTDAPIDSPASGTNGSTTLSATNSSFAAGQKILIHQTRGTNAGTYQLNEIQAYTAGTITLTTPLNATYSTNTGANKAQVLVVKQYTNVTVNAGVTWSAKNWIGTNGTGGILFFMASGTVNINGTINATGKGFYGGSQTNAPTPQSPFFGYQAEGTFGGPNTRTNQANGNGGGGGREPDNNGGAGGGHGTNGANGHGNNAQGGSTVGSANLSNMNLGGGGGGGAPGGGGMENGLAGGNGGGIIGIMANTLNVNGTVEAKGSNGGIHSTHFGGGAGAGGSIKVITDTATLGTNKLVATGGVGGGNRPGGAGGTGRIALQYCGSTTGTTNPTINTVQINCGKDNFSGRWTSYINSDETEDYTFIINSDDGVRMWVNGNQIIDRWTAGDAQSQGTAQLIQGINEVKVEYFEGTGNAYINLDYYPSSNLAPEIGEIEDQLIGQGDSFAAFDLDDYGSDPDNDPVTWSYSGNSSIQVNKNQNNIVTLTYPQGWSGEETIAFKAKDPWGLEYMASANFGVLECAVGEFKTEYFNNTNLSGNAISSGCEEGINQNWGSNGPIVPNLGNGQNGALTISTNTTDAPIDSASSGTQNATTLTATNVNFAAGQKVLIHQTLGTGAGTYQFNEIASYTSGTITLANPLNATYSSSGSNKAQILVIKQYTNVTINSGVTLSAKAWDGSTGGILIFYANGTVTVNGNISANAKGYRGGAAAPNINDRNGRQGESYNGIGTTNNAANAGAGGGGKGDPNAHPSGPAGLGGAGGGHYAAGTNGQGATGQPNSVGGAAYSTNFPQTLFFGSGGGGGGADSDNCCSPAGGKGGNGGGIIFVKGNSINVTGTITSNGENGYQSGPYSGGGGAGAGGSVVLDSPTLTLNANKVQITGGTGGTGGGSVTYGAAGSKGRLSLSYCSNISGTYDANAVITQSACPADNFSARWNGYVNIEEEGSYTVDLSSDDGVKVWVDSNLVVDEWGTGTHDIEEEIQLTEGLHEIKVEYFEGTGSAGINLDLYPTPIGEELLSEAWHLSGDNGASEEYQSIDTGALAGKTTMRITYNLHGLEALGGDASAIIFDQNGWQYISLSEYGDNGLDGVQVVDIPLSDFTNLNLTEGSNTVHTRFWYGSPFTVDIHSIRVF